MIKDIRIAMIAAASNALNHHKKNPNAQIEDAMRHVLASIDAKDNAKLGAIAAANYILKFKQKNPNSTEKEAMQALTNETERIISSIQNQEM
jgi:hypothetical protein